MAVQFFRCLEREAAWAFSGLLLQFKWKKKCNESFSELVKYKAQVLLTLCGVSCWAWGGASITVRGVDVENRLRLQPQEVLKVVLEPWTSSISGDKACGTVLGVAMVGSRCLGPSGVQGISSRASKNSVPSESADGEWGFRLNEREWPVVRFSRSVPLPWIGGSPPCRTRPWSVTPTMPIRPLSHVSVGNARARDSLRRCKNSNSTARPPTPINPCSRLQKPK